MAHPTLGSTQWNADAREDRVEPSLGERHVLEAAEVEADELRVFHPPTRDLDQVSSRVDRLDAQAARDQLLGQLPRPAAHLDDP